MNQIRVTIAGKEYTISTEEDQSRVYGLARQLDSKLEDFLKACPTASLYTAALITALSCLDDVDKASNVNDDILLKAKEYVQEAGLIKVENDSLTRENEKLSLRVDQLEKELNELKKSLESNKK